MMGCVLSVLSNKTVLYWSGISRSHDKEGMGKKNKTTTVAFWSVVEMVMDQCQQDSQSFNITKTRLVSHTDVPGATLNMML